MVGDSSNILVGVNDSCDADRHRCQCRKAAVKYTPQCFVFPGVTMLAGFFLLLLLVFDMTPEAASSIPLLTVYVFVNMVLVTVGMFLSVFVCFVHDLPETAPMSTCFRTVCLIPVFRSSLLIRQYNKRNF